MRRAGDWTQWADLREQWTPGVPETSARHQRGQNDFSNKTEVVTAFSLCCWRPCRYQGNDGERTGPQKPGPWPPDSAAVVLCAVPMQGPVTSCNCYRCYSASSLTHPSFHCVRSVMCAQHTLGHPGVLLARLPSRDSAQPWSWERTRLLGPWAAFTRKTP